MEDVWESFLTPLSLRRARGEDSPKYERSRRLVNAPPAPYALRLMMHRPATLWMSALALTLAGGVAGVTAQEAAGDKEAVVGGAERGNDAVDATVEIDPSLIARPDKLAPIMPFDDVRVGMKGYGMTVFHGTKIEPFPVEVVSIARNETPQQGVIWIRCPSDRMQESGPVQGMSGSPIYLWDGDEEVQKLGEGGRLIGAFAFGYAMSKDCLVGVQPIEQMRAIAGRIEADDTRDAGGGETQKKAGDKKKRGGGSMRALATLDTLAASAGEAKLPAAQRFRLEAVRRILKGRELGTTRDEAREPTPQISNLKSQISNLKSEISEPTLPSPRPLLLPVTVGDASTARWLSPLLTPMGLSAVPAAAPGAASALGTKPPPDVDPAQAALRPGSVLSIPLAWGDIELSGIGTVTDVLPDGRVLAFGHAMFAQGHTALPMATGYVHFVQPHLVTSFKQSGSLNIVGSLVQDEQTGVAGAPVTRFTSAPVSVAIHQPDQPDRTYRYRVVHHEMLTPMVAATVVVMSLNAVQAIPMENTLRLKGSMTFSGNRTLTLDALQAGGSDMSVAMELVPALAALQQNPHESLFLQSMDLEITVEPELRMAQIVDATLEQSEVEPGEEATVTVYLQPYEGERIRRKVTLKVPPSLAEGDYPLTIGDAQTYTMMLLSSRPHLLQTRSVDDLMKLMQQIYDIQPDAMYAMLPLPEAALAVGRTEMPDLPSSRRALLETPGSTLTSDYGRMIVKKRSTDMVISGQVSFTVSVREKGKR